MIGDSEGDDLESFYTKMFRRIEDHIDDLRHRLNDLFNIF